MKLQSLKGRIAQISIRQLSGLQQGTPVQRMRGRALQRRNHRFLHHNPLCVHCLKKGKVTAAQEVDHIIPLAEGGPDRESNLQGLCIPCHEIKSAEETRARAQLQAR